MMHVSPHLGNFVHFTRHTASTHHTFKDTKEAYIRSVSLKQREYALDVRKSIKDKKPHVFTIPGRNQATPSTLTTLICPTQAGKVATAAEQLERASINMICLLMKLK